MLTSRPIRGMPSQSRIIWPSFFQLQTPSSAMATSPRESKESAFFSPSQSHNVREMSLKPSSAGSGPRIVGSYPGEADLTDNAAHRDHEGRGPALVLGEPEVYEFIWVGGGPVSAGLDDLLRDPRPGDQGLHMM